MRLPDATAVATTPATPISRITARACETSSLLRSHINSHRKRTKRRVAVFISHSRVILTPTPKLHDVTDGDEEYEADQNNHTDLVSVPFKRRTDLFPQDFFQKNESEAPAV